MADTEHTDSVLVITTVGTSLSMLALVTAGTRQAMTFIVRAIAVATAGVAFAKANQSVAIVATPTVDAVTFALVAESMVVATTGAAVVPYLHVTGLTSPAGVTFAFSTTTETASIAVAFANGSDLTIVTIPTRLAETFSVTARAVFTAIFLLTRRTIVAAIAATEARLAVAFGRRNVTDSVTRAFVFVGGWASLALITSSASEFDVARAFAIRLTLAVTRTVLRASNRTVDTLSSRVALALSSHTLSCSATILWTSEL
jgi:hypothetical protein